MLAIRLVRLIESHSEQLSRGLTERVWNCPRCSDLRKIPPEEFKARTQEIYRNLSDWLLDKTEAEVERRYIGLGARRASQGVSFSHFLWGVTATKEHIRDFLLREGLVDSAVDLYGEVELLALLDQFFDRALYYAAIGFERHAASRGRTEGPQVVTTRAA